MLCDDYISQQEKNKMKDYESITANDSNCYGCEHKSCYVCYCLNCEKDHEDCLCYCEEQE